MPLAIPQCHTCLFRLFRVRELAGRSSHSSPNTPKRHFFWLLRHARRPKGARTRGLAPGRTQRQALGAVLWEARCRVQAPSTVRPLARWPGTRDPHGGGTRVMIGWLAGHCLWVLVWAGACYWHGVGEFMFNSPSSLCRVQGAVKDGKSLASGRPDAGVVGGLGHGQVVVLLFIRFEIMRACCAYWPLTEPKGDPFHPLDGARPGCARQLTLLPRQHAVAVLSSVVSQTRERQVLRVVHLRACSP